MPFSVVPSLSLIPNACARSWLGIGDGVATVFDVSIESRVTEELIDCAGRFLPREASPRVPGFVTARLIALRGCRRKGAEKGDEEATDRSFCPRLFDEDDGAAKAVDGPFSLVTGVDTTTTLIGGRSYPAG